MKINFDSPILDLKGQSINDEVGNPATLGTLAVGALMAQFSSEGELPAAEKVSRFVLAAAIANGGVIDLKVEDITLIKKLIGKAFGPLAVGRAYEILDPPG